MPTRYVKIQLEASSANANRVIKKTALPTPAVPWEKNALRLTSVPLENTTVTVACNV